MSRGLLFLIAAASGALGAYLVLRAWDDAGLSKANIDFAPVLLPHHITLHPAPETLQ